jgi:hypothetical protein
MASGSLTSASGALIVVNSHAAYIEKAGRASESGVGNALVGSYLTQIGLSENAVVYITQAAPTEMTWLNLREAKQIGIEVLPFEEQTHIASSHPPASCSRLYGAIGNVPSSKWSSVVRVLMGQCRF